MLMKLPFAATQVTNPWSPSSSIRLGHNIVSYICPLHDPRNNKGKNLDSIQIPRFLARCPPAIGPRVLLLDSRASPEGHMQAMDMSTARLNCKRQVGPLSFSPPSWKPPSRCPLAKRASLHAHDGPRFHDLRLLQHHGIGVVWSLCICERAEQSCRAGGSSS